MTVSGPQLSTDELIKRIFSLAQGRILRRMAEQFKKHDGDTNVHSEMDWVSLLLEELGEAADVANTIRWISDDSVVTDQFIDELVDVAALAIWAIVWGQNGRRSTIKAMRGNYKLEERS